MNIEKYRQLQTMTRRAEYINQVFITQIKLIIKIVLLLELAGWIVFCIIARLGYLN